MSKRRKCDRKNTWAEFSPLFENLLPTRPLFFFFFLMSFHCVAMQEMRRWHFVTFLFTLIESYIEYDLMWYWVIWYDIESYRVRTLYSWLFVPWQLDEERQCIKPSSVVMIFIQFYMLHYWTVLFLINFNFHSLEFHWLSVKETCWFQAFI